MKTINKIIFTIILVFVCANTANSELRWGIKAGMNVNKISYNQDLLNNFEDNSCGWNAGVYADFTVPVIGIGMDASLLYSRMNNGNTVKTSLDEQEDMFGRNFLEIPINVKYKFTIPVVATIIKPYLFTGPSFAIKLDKETLDFYKTKTFQVAWNVGLGLELVRHLQIQASYGFGINNIAKNWINTQDLKAKNNYWTIGVGYLF